MKKVCFAALLLTASAFSQAYGQQLFVTDQVDPPPLNVGNDNISVSTTPGSPTVFVPNMAGTSGNQIDNLNPTGIIFGPTDGNIYVVGTGFGEVLRYSGSTGAALPGPLIGLPPPMSPPNAQFTTGNGLSGAQGIAFGSDGNIYVTNMNNISQFNGLTGAFIQNFTPVPGVGNPSFSGITRGPDGALYVADFNGSPQDPYHDSILRLDPTQLTPQMQFSTYVSSAHSVNGDNPLNSPTGITFGSDGNLYIAATEQPAIGGRVLRFSGMTDTLDVFVANGSANLQQPKGLVFGPDGNLYVSSWFHNPPPGTPVTPTFVARYEGLADPTPGSFMDYYAQGTSTEAYWGVAFPTFAAIPEASTIAIGVMIAVLLILHWTGRARLSFARSKLPNKRQPR